MKTRLIIALTVASLLTGCTQLSSSEQREALRLECLNKAEYSTDLKKAAFQKKYGSKRLAFVKDTQETKKLKSLCRQMTDASAYEP